MQTFPAILMGLLTGFRQWNGPDSDSSRRLFSEPRSAGEAFTWAMGRQNMELLVFKIELAPIARGRFDSTSKLPG